jgi:hypothetical protein
MDVAGPLNGIANKVFHLVGANDTLIIDQLIGEKVDKVHPVATTREGFIADRVGSGMDTHQTWVRTGENGEVEAALYTARFNKNIMTEADFCGNAEKILTGAPCKVKGDEKPSFIFYSISSFKRGAGEGLIGAVRGAMEESSPDMTASTLSPLRVAGGKPAEDRNFTDWLKTEITGDVNDIRSDTERLKGYALQYLSENRHLVQKFHMGNGAYIGDVNVNANVKESADYTDGMNVMMNYVYPGEAMRQELQASYQSGQMVMAPHLVDQANRAQNRTVFKPFIS